MAKGPSKWHCPLSAGTASFGSTAVPFIEAGGVAAIVVEVETVDNGMEEERSDVAAAVTAPTRVEVMGDRRRQMSPVHAVRLRLAVVGSCLPFATGSRIANAHDSWEGFVQKATDVVSIQGVTDNESPVESCHK